MNIKCMIIDDEPSSQKVLEVFIEKVSFLQVLSICDNATEALEKFLDSPASKDSTEL